MGKVAVVAHSRKSFGGGLRELDGGARPAVREMRVKARPGSIKICVPAKVASASTAAAADEHA